MRPTAMVSGPYMSLGRSMVDDCVGRAEACSIWLWENDYYVLTPHLNTRNFHELVNQHESVYLDFWKKVIRSGLVDLLVMTYNWNQSDGALKENQLARHLGIPIYEWQLTWRPQEIRRIG